MKWTKLSSYLAPRVFLKDKKEDTRCQSLHRRNRQSYAIKEVESIISNLLKWKVRGSDGFSGKFYQIFKEEIISILKLDKDITRKEIYKPVSLMNKDAKVSTKY